VKEFKTERISWNNATLDSHATAQATHKQRQSNASIAVASRVEDEAGPCSKDDKNKHVLHG
jgi:hypothetical protein